MTDPEIMALAQEAQDNGSALALALLEFLTEKQHSTGAIRAMSPYVTKDESKKVIAMAADMIKRLASERKAAREKAGKSDGGVLLPSSGLVVPRG